MPSNDDRHGGLRYKVWGFNAVIWLIAKIYNFYEKSLVLWCFIWWTLWIDLLSVSWLIKSYTRYKIMVHSNQTQTWKALLFTPTVDTIFQWYHHFLQWKKRIIKSSGINKLDPCTISHSASSYLAIARQIHDMNQAAGAKQIVLCFDGTGYEFRGDDTDSNVLKIYRVWELI